MAIDSVWLGGVPVMVAEAAEPGAPVVIVPTARLFGGPVGPVLPMGP
jgi:hypothetical protein